MGSELQATIQVVLVEPALESVATLARVLEKSKQADLLPVPTADEAWQVAQQFTPCVLFVSIRGTLDGAPQLEMLKKLEKMIRSGQVKPLVVSSVKRHPLARQIAALGVTDYAEEPIPAKSLLFKVNLIFKSIRAAQDRSEKKAKGVESIVFKADDATAKEATVVAEAKKHKPALQLAEDTFVFKGARPRRIGKNYILEAEGPAPETGEWQEIRGSGGVQNWKWQPHSGKQGEEEEKGNWVHEGEKPEFNARTGKWKLASTKPGLYFERKGKKIAAKVETDEEGAVLIAEDSDAARNNLILNHTLAAQAREEQSKKALGRGDWQEEHGEFRKRNVGADTAETEEAQEKAPQNLLSLEEKRKERARQRLEEGSQTTRAVAQSSEEEAEEKRKKIAVAEEESETETRSKEGLAEEAEEAAVLRQSDLSTEGESDELVLVTREAKLKGLKKDDLESRRNLRTQHSAMKDKSFEPEEEGSGLDPKQLDSAKNRRQPQDARSHDLKPGGGEASSESGPGGEESREDQEKLLRELLDKKSEERRRQKEKRQLEEAEEKAQARLRSLREELEKEKHRPLREQIEEEEERKLRHELGLPEEEGLGHRRLDELAREKKTGELKAQMEEIEAGLAGTGLPLLALFPPEEAPLQRDERGEDKGKERNFRAIDSLEEEAGSYWEKLKKQKKKEKEESPKIGENNPVFHYLPIAEVQPLEGAWEEADGYWVYLPETAFSRGAIENLLPCWVYKGWPEPEIEREKWRFAEVPPELISNAEDLPIAVQDLLANLKAQAALLGEKGSEASGGVNQEASGESQGGVREKSGREEREGKLREEEQLEAAGKIREESEQESSAKLVEKADSTRENSKRKAKEAEPQEKALKEASLENDEGEIEEKGETGKKVKGAIRRAEKSEREGKAKLTEEKDRDALSVEESPDEETPRLSKEEKARQELSRPDGEGPKNPKGEEELSLERDKGTLSQKGGDSPAEDPTEAREKEQATVAGSDPSTLSRPSSKDLLALGAIVSVLRRELEPPACLGGLEACFPGLRFGFAAGSSVKASNGAEFQAELFAKIERIELENGYALVVGSEASLSPEQRGRLLWFTAALLKLPPSQEAQAA